MSRGIGRVCWSVADVLVSVPMRIVGRENGMAGGNRRARRATSTTERGGEPGERSGRGRH
ncbi:hypothetical protein K0M31_004146 [Melipona bicolor]|uniref:Uncharacterized protein n=1 Tax=Melipona bicolor TaxID=60889 RepID=A0AA40FY79_9HYME|nr:hypothetical protein K0M31_004146 [Melipona bicolor]